MAAGSKAYSSFCETTEPHTPPLGRARQNSCLEDQLEQDCLSARQQRHRDAGTRKRDEKRKQKIKEVADRGKHNIPQLAHGNNVIIRQEPRNKLTPHYEPRPLKVIAVKGSIITAARPTGEKITRNRSHFKLIPDTSKTTTPITQMQGERDDEWPGEDRNEFCPSGRPASASSARSPTGKTTLPSSRAPSTETFHG